MLRTRSECGFSLVELVAVIVLLAVISVTLVSRFGPSSVMSLQASRDSIVAALSSAQQLAMARTGNVVVTTGGGQVDIRHQDISVTVGGVQYPFKLPPNQRISNHTFEYDRLGKTKEASASTLITLSQGSNKVTINVSASGFSQ